MIAGARLCTITITSSRERIIGDALRSAPFADGFVVVDLGIADGTLEVVRQVAGGRPVHVVEHPWADDTAAPRNTGLEEAARQGYGLACVLDTDERLLLRGEDLDAVLAEGDTWNAWNDVHTYTKARFIRLPAARRFEDDTHEVYHNLGGDPVLDRLRFHELPKSPERIREQSVYVLRKMNERLKRHDLPVGSRVRALLYRAEAQQALGHPWLALDDFMAVLDSQGDPEECARAGYECAAMLIDMATKKLGSDEPKEIKRAKSLLRQAVRAAALGMVRHPGTPEHPLYAAVASVHLEDWGGALCWARYATMAGSYSGMGGEIDRFGVMHPPAHFEAPFEVIRVVYERTGQPEAAEEAGRLEQAAKAMRLAQEMGG